MRWWWFAAVLLACETSEPATTATAPPPGSVAVPNPVTSPMTSPMTSPVLEPATSPAVDPDRSPRSAVPTPPRPTPSGPPPGLVDVRSALPNVRLSLGYARADNFTGAPLPGYAPDNAVAVVWAHPKLVEALAEVDRELAVEGLGLLVYDAYRPLRATRAMVAWARQAGRSDLLRDGYIAARSQHNRGLAIDLSLVSRDDGALVDMGGAWDTFDRSSAAFAATGQALVHRRRLRAVMTAHRFVAHDGEWWHFSLPHATAPVLDVPYAADPQRPAR